MFAITWQIAIFLLCTVVTLILERAMSNVPEVVWRATYSALLLGLVIKTLLSQPVYEYVRNPRAHQVISLMLIVAACGIIFGTIWCFFVIGFPSSEAYVSTRIKSQLAKWIPPVNFTLLPDDPKAYFRYQITFGDGISIYAVRKKNEGSLKLQS